jgi:uncharacterized SAM-binding protein YcdF (DUF218 family)
MSRDERPQPAAREATACLGLLRRRACWCLTWRGALVLLGLIALLGWLGLGTIHPFLAVTETVPARVLVVEGWGSDDILQRAVSEFNTGAYDRIHVTGVPLDRGEPLSEYKSWAEHGAERLRRYGLAANVVVATPAPAVRQDRTFASAVALRRWFETNGGAPDSVNVITGGAHARRTRLLFQQALGDAVQVGIIAHPNPNYDPALWWRSSTGVRAVVDETVAWCYARLFFEPPAE